MKYTLQDILKMKEHLLVWLTNIRDIKYVMRLLCFKRLKTKVLKITNLNLMIAILVVNNSLMLFPQTIINKWLIKYNRTYKKITMDKHLYSNQDLMKCYKINNKMILIFQAKVYKI
jgi:hypothetical protein